MKREMDIPALSELGPTVEGLVPRIGKGEIVIYLISLAGTAILFLEIAQLCF